MANGDTNTWETVDIIHKGANEVGILCAKRTKSLETTNKTAALPADDKIPVQLNATETDGMVTPTYPVIEYPHLAGGGDVAYVAACASRQGWAFSPALRGKYFFSAIFDRKRLVCRFQGDAGG